MLAYLGGQDVVLTIPLVDANGNDLGASAVQYRVIDQDETELVAKVALAGFNSGDVEAVVTVSAINNALGTAVRGLRVVELYVTSATGVTLITTEYVLEAPSVLVVGTNSVQGYSTAVMAAYELPSLTAWGEAGKTDRINALMAAYRNLGKLRLSGIGYSSDSIGGITELSAANIAALDADFRAALGRAQVIEADFLLGGDEVGDIRRSGIMSATIGESSQFFRTTKPYEGAVCKRALKELSSYLVRDVSIGRA